MPRAARKATPPATYEIPLVVDAALVDELMSRSGHRTADEAIVEAIRESVEAYRSQNQLEDIGRQLGPRYIRELERQHGRRIAGK